MAGTDSKIGIWTETTVEGQPYWHSTGIANRLPWVEAPAAPTGLAVTPGSTTAPLTWNAVTGADSIALYRRDDTAMGSFALVTAAIAGNATSYNDTGLTPENAYSWYITATNEVGTSAPSSTVTNTTVAAGELTLTGTIAHGNTITITTNGTYDFGTRTNATPVQVFYGDGKTSSSLGRRVQDDFNASAVYQTSVKLGQIAGAVRFDHKVTSNGSLNIIPIAPDKPAITYIERYRDYDTQVPAYQNSTGGFNLKTQRYWYNTAGGTNNNVYAGYNQQTKEAQVNVEYVGNNVLNYYNRYAPAFQWINEEYFFKNSSASGVRDGYLYHYIDNEWLNPFNSGNGRWRHEICTFDAENPNPISAETWDQVSNGAGEGVSNVYTYFGYAVRDDEYKAVYVGDADTIAACTKLVRLPGVSWSSNSVSAVFVETHISAANAYFYVMNDFDAANDARVWVSTGGIR